ncbi:MAG TPA: hypothetical protein VMC84_01565 [Methanocella sp.]|uniref:hypothetical protein n=1 Tax=Methanocella sp. TaxID=2052833 RepID=UPI002BF49376|nr:hypothetical protein [Methanocella sp.]HTY89841.1 hypothetical protein [Methanocella sp.]
MDQDTANKIEKINRKIEEINQRRAGLHMTKIEDDLDRQELNDYIDTLNLTTEQKSLIDSYSQTSVRTLQNQSAFYYSMMIVSVFIEAYLGYAIIDMIMQPGLDMLNTAFLYMMIAVFIINAFYVLRFMRIMK